MGELVLIDLKSQAAAHRFRSHQDELDYAVHSVEDVNGLLAAQFVDALDRYIKGEVDCHVRFFDRLSKRQSDFVFRRIPPDAGAVPCKTAEPSAQSESFPPLYGWNSRKISTTSVGISLQTFLPTMSLSKPATRSPFSWKYRAPLPCDKRK